jgi:chromosome partitioning protein
MTTLTICNHKGGTGKTTSVIHVAAALGHSGKRVLVFDLDPQGFLTSTLDVDEPPPEESIAAFFDPDLDPGRIRLHEAGGFDLVPSSSTLTRRMRRLNKPTDVLWVREALDTLSLDYDLILFDTAAAVTVYSLNALVACDHVLIPVLPEYQSVIGAEQTFQTAAMVRKKLNPGLQSRMLMFTQVDGRKRVHQTYREYIRDKYGDAHVLDAEIRTSTSLTRAYDAGETVFDHDPNARGARDYANAGDELWQRMHAASDASETAVDAEQRPPEPDESTGDADSGNAVPSSPPLFPSR